MVIVPAGWFTMGSPEDEPERDYDREDPVPVTIGKPFAVGRFAVTRGEFAAFVAATGHKTDGGCYGSHGSEWKPQATRLAFSGFPRTIAIPWCASTGTTPRPTRRGCPRRRARPTGCCRRPSANT